MHKYSIGFSKSTKKFKPLGYTIEALQKWRYSHCFIMFHSDLLDEFYVIDATGNGVRVRTLKMFLKDNLVVKQYEVRSEKVLDNKMLKWGLKKSGLKYPSIEVFGNLIQLISWRLFKKQINNPFGQGENMPRCNELCAIFLKEVLGIKIEKDLDSIDLIWLDDFMEKNL